MAAVNQDLTAGMGESSIIINLVKFYNSSLIKNTLIKAFLTFLAIDIWKCAEEG